LVLNSLSHRTNHLSIQQSLAHSEHGLVAPVDVFWQERFPPLPPVDIKAAAAPDKTERLVSDWETNDHLVGASPTSLVTTVSNSLQYHITKSPPFSMTLNSTNWKFSI
jgi:hypothetical protein